MLPTKLEQGIIFLQPDSPAAFASFAEFEQLDVKKYERPKPPHKEYIPTAFNQEKALKNWRKKMLQRKKIQGYVSSRNIFAFISLNLLLVS